MTNCGKSAQIFVFVSVQDRSSSLLAHRVFRCVTICSVLVRFPHYAKTNDRLDCRHSLAACVVSLRACEYGADHSCSGARWRRARHRPQWRSPFHTSSSGVEGLSTMPEPTGSRRSQCKGSGGETCFQSTRFDRHLGFQRIGPARYTATDDRVGKATARSHHGR